MTVLDDCFRFGPVRTNPVRFDVAGHAIILTAPVTYGILGLKWISRGASFPWNKGNATILNPAKATVSHAPISLILHPFWLHLDTPFAATSTPIFSSLVSLLVNMLVLDQALK